MVISMPILRRRRGGSVSSRVVGAAALVPDRQLAGARRERRGCERCRRPRPAPSRARRRRRCSRTSRGGRCRRRARCRPRGRPRSSPCPCPTSPRSKELRPETEKTLWRIGSWFGKRDGRAGRHHQDARLERLAHGHHVDHDRLGGRDRLAGGEDHDRGVDGERLVRRRFALFEQLDAAPELGGGGWQNAQQGSGDERREGADQCAHGDWKSA